MSEGPPDSDADSNAGSDAEDDAAARAEEAAARAERAEHAAEHAERAAESERRNNDRLAARLYSQWAQLREERQAQLTPAVPTVTSSGSRKVEVPYGIDLAASWGWRLLVIVAAGWCLFKALGFLEVVVVPVVIALLISALVVPVVALLTRSGLPRGIAALLVVIGVIAVVGSLLFFAGHQVATGASDLADQTVKGLEEIRRWLKNGPLHASDNQINTWIDRLQSEVTKAGAGGNPLGKVSEVGGVAADVLASLFIVLFSTYFFLSEGDQIWSWVVRLTPRAARGRVDSSGRVAWISLTQFVRATVIVAAVDAIGIMIVAAILRVPFVAAIGVLVFLGAFVPLVGATVAGTVAVLVALVDHGLVTALFMLGGVILVQQLEAHGLQPFLLGRWVSVHPLAVIIAIATGILVAGIAGALVAVPLAAALNAVGQHLAADAAPPDPERDEGELLTEGERHEVETVGKGNHE